MLTSPSLFCPDCHAYRGLCRDECPSCGRPAPQDCPQSQPGQPLWTARIGGPGRGLPLICGGKVLFAWGLRLDGGGVSARQLTDGNPAWEAGAEHSVENMACDGERVYYASAGFIGGGARLHCYSVTDEAELWSVPLSGSAWSPPVVEENRLYIACDDGLVHCLDPRTGQGLSNWPVRLEKGRLWLVRCADHLVALGVGGFAAAIDPLRGSQRIPTIWRLERQVTSAPGVAGQRLYFGVNGGQVWSLDVRSGQKREIAKGLKNVIAAPLVASKRLLVGAHDHFLHAYDLESTQELWKMDCMHAISAPPTAASGLVIAAATHGELFAFELESGNPAWRYDCGAYPLVSSPLLHQGMVYCSSEAGQAFALPWHNGSYEWAGDWLERQADFSAAGDMFALAGDLQTVDEDGRKALYERAIKSWRRSRQPQKAAFFRESQPGEEPAAVAAEYERAARLLYPVDPSLAAYLFNRAADWRHEANEPTAARRLGLAALRAAHAPYISIRSLNIPAEWEAGEEMIATFELKNQGNHPAQDLRVRLAGSSLKYRLWIIPEHGLGGGDTMEIETPVEPSASGNLVIEVHYADTQGRNWSSPRAFPLQVTAYQGNRLDVGGDVGALRLENWQGRIKINGDVGLARISSADPPGNAGSGAPAREFPWPGPGTGFATDPLELARVIQVQNDELTLDAGYWAFFLADGRLVGRIAPGRYIRRDYAELRASPLPGGRRPLWEAVRFRHSEVRLAFRLGPYPTADLPEVGMDLGLSIQAEPEGAFDFWQKIAGERKTLNASDLVEWLTPEVSGILKNWLSSRPHAELSFSQRDRVSLELEEELRQTCQRHGLQLVGRLWALEFHIPPGGNQ